MNLFEHFDSLPAAQAVGWTLLHFVWQGAVLAAVLWTVLHLMREGSANVRYLVCCWGMALMLAAPATTLLVLLQAASESHVASIADFFPITPISLSYWERLAPFLPWLTFFWLCGTFLLQGRLLMQWSGTLRMRSKGARIAPTKARRMVADLCRLLNVRRRVRVMQSSLAPIPMVMGWLRPVILLPVNIVTGLSPVQLKAILAHELAHVRRHDYIVNLVQAVFEALLFYHPAVWWLSSRLRIEREYCCDDVAVGVCRDALSYAKALASLEALRDEECQPALASTGGTLMNRIFRITGVRSRPSPRLGGWLVPLVFAATMAVAFTAMATSPATAQDEKEKVHVKKIAREKPAAIMIKTDGGKAYYVEDASLEDVKALVSKMEKGGKSHDEIQQALFTKYHMQVFKKEQAIKLAELEKKYSEKMKAEGKSDEEIKAACKEMYAKKSKVSEDAAMKYAEKAAYLDTMRLRKLEQKGVPSEKIQAALNERRMNDQTIANTKEKAAQEEKMLVQKMKAEGKSEEEIKAALHKMRWSKVKADNEKSEMKKAEEAAKIKAMKKKQAEEAARKKAEKESGAVDI